MTTAWPPALVIGMALLLAVPAGAQQPSQAPVPPAFPQAPYLSPPQPPIVATPLPPPSGPVPPTVQYPPAAPAPAQTVQPQLVPGQPQMAAPAVPGVPQSPQTPGGQAQLPQTLPGQPPAAGAPGQTGPDGQGQPTAQEPTPPSPNPWLPQGGVVLQALDKANAQTTALTAKTGTTITFESLTITVQACVVRPPDMPQDAAAFLTIADGHPDEPGFRGWMLKSNPSLSMLEHPLYDVRVLGCTP